MNRRKGDADTTVVVVSGIVIVCLLLAAVVGSMCIFPIYNVWKAGKNGEAALRQAESEKMILVEAAKAERDASKLRAEAITIVGAAAKAYPEFRQQEFIAAFADALQAGRISQIIYVPTENNIPITEMRVRN